MYKIINLFKTKNKTKNKNKLFSKLLNLPNEILIIIIYHSKNNKIKFVCKYFYYLTKTEYLQFICPWINMPKSWQYEPIISYKAILAIRYNNYYAFKWSIDNGACWYDTYLELINNNNDIRIIDLIINKTGTGMFKRKQILNYLSKNSINT